MSIGSMTSGSAATSSISKPRLVFNVASAACGSSGLDSNTPIFFGSLVRRNSNGRESTWDCGVTVSSFCQ